VAAIPGLEAIIDADHIVRGEGISWMRRYLGEDEQAPIRHPRSFPGWRLGYWECVFRSARVELPQPSSISGLSDGVQLLHNLRLFWWQRKVRQLLRDWR